jgi:hypothetical protein
MNGHNEVFWFSMNRGKWHQACHRMARKAHEVAADILQPCTPTLTLTLTHSHSVHTPTHSHSLTHTRGDSAHPGTRRHSFESLETLPSHSAHTRQWAESADHSRPNIPSSHTHSAHTHTHTLCLTHPSHPTHPIPGGGVGGILRLTALNACLYKREDTVTLCVRALTCSRSLRCSNGISQRACDRQRDI